MIGSGCAFDECHKVKDGIVLHLFGLCSIFQSNANTCLEAAHASKSGLDVPQYSGKGRFSRTKADASTHMVYEERLLGKELMHQAIVNMCTDEHLNIKGLADQDA